MSVMRDINCKRIALVPGPSTKTKFFLSKGRSMEKFNLLAENNLHQETHFFCQCARVK